MTKIAKEVAEAMAKISVADGTAAQFFGSSSRNLINKGNLMLFIANNIKDGALNNGVTDIVDGIENTNIVELLSKPEAKTSLHAIYLACNEKPAFKLPQPQILKADEKPASKIEEKTI